MDSILDTTVTKSTSLVAATTAGTSASIPSPAPIATPHRSADASPVAAQAPPVTRLRQHPVPAPLRPFVQESGDLVAFMADDLAKSGLAVDDVPFWYAVDGSGVDRYCRLSGGTPSGYAIPYIGLDGKPTQDHGSDFVRFRLMSPLSMVIDKDGQIKGRGKYVSPKDSLAHIYIPEATAKLLRNPATGKDLPLVITEGEKKAEALVQHTGIPSVALAGIHMWFDPEEDRKTALSQRPLHPELLEVIEAYTEWVDGKPVVLVTFDSDGAPLKGVAAKGNAVDARDSRGRTVRVRNADVHNAALTLAHRIYAVRQMSVATSASWCPEGPRGTKQGLDDWILAAGKNDVESAILALAERPDHKIQNKSGLPSHVLTNNNAQDTDVLTAALLDNPNVFVFGNSPAIIEPGSSSIRVASTPGALAIQISRMVQTFEERDSGSLKACYVPTHLCAAMLESDWSTMPGVRKVAGIFEHPAPVLVNGRVEIAREGYDARTGLFGAFDPEDWDLGNAKTEGQSARKSALARACEIVAELTNELYLQAPADLAAVIAAMITAIARPGLPVAPGFVLSAPNSGAGKSYIAEMLAELASGRGYTESTDVLTLDTKRQGADAEFSKMMLGSLQNARPVVLFDELAGNAIDGPSLRKLITSPVFSDRALGANRTISLPTRKLILITANNVDPRMDSARRFIIVRINPPTDAAKRNYTPGRGAVDLIREDRQTYVEALLTLSRVGSKYCSAQTGMPGGLNALSGFDAWNAVAAGPAVIGAWWILWSGKVPANLVDSSGVESITARHPQNDKIEEINPMLRQRETAASDPALQAVHDLLESLYKFQSIACEGKPWTVSMLQVEVNRQRQIASRYKSAVYGSEHSPDEFAIYSELIASGLRDYQLDNIRSLGHAVRALKDRQVGGYVLADRKTREGVNEWLVSKT